MSYLGVASVGSGLTSTPLVCPVRLCMDCDVRDSGEHPHALISYALPLIFLTQHGFTTRTALRRHLLDDTPCQVSLCCHTRRAASLKGILSHRFLSIHSRSIFKRQLDASHRVQHISIPLLTISPTVSRTFQYLRSPSYNPHKL